MNIQSTAMTKKEEILQTTLRLIVRQGFHATPMSQIIEQSGVAAGTIYHYFKSKEELIHSLYAQLKEEFGTVLKSTPQAGKKYKERFFSMWKNVHRFFIEEPDKFRFLEQYANSPLIDRDVRAANTRHYQSAYDFFAEGIEAGVFRSLPVELMASLVFGNIVSTVKTELSEENNLSQSLIDRIIQSSWDGIKIN